MEFLFAHFVRDINRFMGGWEAENKTQNRNTGNRAIQGRQPHGVIPNRIHIEYPRARSSHGRTVGS